MTVVKFLGFILLLTFLVTGGALAQDDDDDYSTKPSDTSATEPPEKPSKFDWSRVQIGGGLGLQFGSTTVIDIAPTFGYQITDDFIVGIGITYLYFGIPEYDYSSSVYGGGPFARYIIYEELFAHVEYQVLNSETYLIDQQNRIIAQFRENVQYFWVGAGYRQSLGSNSYLMLMVLYDLNDAPGSIYPTNPIIRMGIGIGL